MKNIFAFILGTSLGLTSFISCTKNALHGPVVQEDRIVSDFTRLTSEIPGDIILTQDEDFKVKVQAQEKIIDDVKTEVSGGHLTISLSHRPRLTTGKNFKVYVSVPKLERMVLEGSGNIEVQNALTESDKVEMVLKGSGNIEIPKLQCEELYAELTGSGKIKINSGTTEELHLQLKGSGNFNAAQFTARNAWINLTGSGNATVRVTQNLYATITGSGNIYYYGNPNLVEHVTGSGKVKRKS
jgi:hypothetical protein